jgi:hypothetical protein
MISWHRRPACVYVRLPGALLRCFKRGRLLPLSVFVSDRSPLLSSVSPLRPPCLCVLLARMPVCAALFLRKQPNPTPNLSPYKLHPAPLDHHPPLLRLHPLHHAFPHPLHHPAPARHRALHTSNTPHGDRPTRSAENTTPCAGFTRVRNVITLASRSIDVWISQSKCQSPDANVCKSTTIRLAPLIRSSRVMHRPQPLLHPKCPSCPILPSPVLGSPSTHALHAQQLPTIWTLCRRISPSCSPPSTISVRIRP